jgi:3-hydroxybutyryl-CoA dehydrogenase
VSINTVAILGAGIMGCDLALDLAGNQIDVILKDLKKDALRRAEENIRKHYKTYRMMKPDRFSRPMTELLSHIRFVTDYTTFDTADMVIENITEDLNEKESVYRKLPDVCRSEIIIGSNTSCISITTLASFVPYPENVIGIHFLNPVPLKNLVEIIRGIHTSGDTLLTTQAFLKNIGKTWIVVKDYPGFVTNRVLMLTINECIWLLQDNVSVPQDIDKIFKLGFGHRMGPLATADLIGLDTILNSLLILFQSYKDPKYRPCPLLQKMVDGGLLGRKSGEGFYKY